MANCTDDMMSGGSREYSRLGEESGDPSLVDIDIRGELLEVLEYETIFPIVGPGIYFGERGRIDGKLNEDNNDKMLNYLEYLEKRVECGEFTDYDIFKKVLAGVQPDVFRQFLKREPTREEVDYCIQDYCRKMKKQIIETGHISDSDHYKEIDLGQQYVQLRLTAGHLTEENSEKSEECYENESRSNDISARNLFDESRGRRVLVKGRTGSGKTTLVQWLTRKWAIGDVEADFSILFVLNVRDLIALGNRAMSLYDLLSNKSLYEIGDAPGFPKQWLKHWSQYVGLIIDGLDEIGSFKDLIKRHSKTLRFIDQNETVFALLCNILKGNLLAESKVIYTTRPFLDLYCLPQKNLSVVQILGFTKDAFLQYIQQHHAENAQKIRTALDNKPALLSACSICFYCVQICSFLSEISADASYDIRTYTQLTAYIMLQLISGKDTDSDLTQMEKTEAYLIKLAHLACGGLFPEQKQNVVPTKLMIFKREHFKNVGLKEEELVMARKDGIILHTGKKGKLFVEGQAEFTHLSFQELIAAGHIIGNHDELERLIKENIITIYDTENMLTLFLFGLGFDDSEILTYFKEHLKCDSDVMQVLISCFEKKTDISAKDDLKLHIAQVAYESQEMKVSNAAQHLLFNTSTENQLIFQNVMFTFLDMSAVIFTCKDRHFEIVEFSNCNIDDVTVSELVGFLQEQHDLQSFDLSGNQFGLPGLSSLCTQLVPAITELHLNDISMGDEGVIRLFLSFQKNGTLKKLSLARNGITFHTREYFTCSKKKYTSSTAHEISLMGMIDFSLADNSITDQGIKNLIEHFPFSTTLKDCTISKNQITKIGAEYLIQKVSSSTRINLSGNQIDVSDTEFGDNVNLHENSLGDERAEVVSENMKLGKTFKVLDLHGLTDYGLYTIAVEVIGSQNLTHITLDGEFTDLDQKQTILDAINHTCTHLEEPCCLNGEMKIDEESTGIINLSSFKLRHDVLIKVLKSLMSKDSIKSLNLRGQALSDDTAHTLAKTLKSLNNLQHLNLESTGLTANGAKKVSQALYSCHELRVLQISKNQFGDVGAEHFANFLRTRKDLKELEIQECSISHVGMYTLMESLKHSENLECLAVSMNSFDERGVQAFGKVCLTSGAISTLKVGKNDIKDREAHILADVLSSCGNLKVFEMDQTFLSKSAWCCIFEALRNHKKIESLSLQRNNLTFGEMDSLAETLRCLANLAEVHLSGNKIGDEGVSNLFKDLHSTKLETLKMEQCNLSCGDILEISAMLSRCINLKSLCLGGSEIGGDAAEHISQSLTLHPKLCELKLRRCGITDNTCIVLSKALMTKGHYELQVLDLGLNRISDKGAAHLSTALQQQEKLQELGLEQNNISDIGAGHISHALEACSQLKRFCIDGNPLKDNGAIKVGTALRTHCHLRILTMAACRLSDGGAIHIAKSLEKHKFLRLLCLEDNNISENGEKIVKDIIKPLKMLAPGIVDARHGSRNIQTHELSSLKWDAVYGIVGKRSDSVEMQEIRKDVKDEVHVNEFELSDTEMNKDDFVSILSHLGGRKELYTLKFCNVKVLDECMMSLAEALRQLPHLEYLILETFSASLPSFLSLTEALSSIRSLKCLVIRECNLYDRGNEDTSIAGHKQDICHQNEISDRGVQAIAQALTHSTHLRELYLNQNQISDRGVEALAQALPCTTQLTQLGLNQNEISDYGAEALAQGLIHTTQLVGLGLSQNQISERGAKALALSLVHSVQLTHLHLDQNQISDGGAEALGQTLRHITQLRVLGLHQNKISDIGAESLAQGLRYTSQLEQLGLNQNHISDRGAEALAQALTHMTQLTQLGLHNNQITDNGAEALAQALRHAKQLSDLDLGKNQISKTGAEPLAHALSQTVQLTHLNLYKNYISVRGAKALSKAFRHTTQLTVLELSKNQISERGAVSLSQALKYTTQLRELYLNHNQISDKGAVALGHALIHTKQLTTLGLYENQISNKGAEALAQALACCAQFLHLGLGQNLISDSGAEALAKTLTHMSEFKYLYLNQNLISDKGVQSLAQALAHTPKLAVLGLGQNQISETGAKALAQALKSTPQLTQLNLSQNQISDSGAEEIAHVLPITTQMTHLNLNENRISDRGAEELARSLVHSPQLIGLGLDQNQISDRGIAALAETLKYSPQLTIYIS